MQRPTLRPSINLERRRLSRPLASLLLLLCLLPACASLDGPEEKQMGLVQKSRHFLKTGHPFLAERVTEEAIALDGPSPYLLNQMAIIRDKEKHPDMALRILVLAHRRYPDSSTLTLNLADEELASNRPSLARNTLQSLLDHQSWPNGFRGLMGRIDLDTGHLVEAHLYLHEALVRHPDNALLLATMGLLHRRLGREKMAREEFRQALVHAPPGPLRVRLLSLLERRDPHPSRMDP